MARPKKSKEETTASQKIIDAFWKLLETNNVRDITISMVASTAGCSRGTFYYHFSSIDSLVYLAIKQEMLGNSTLPQELVALVSATDVRDVPGLFSGLKSSRMSLAMKQGGFELVNENVSSIVLSMWQMVLCPDGHPLKNETRSLIEFTSSAMLGLAAYSGDLSANGQEVVIPNDFVQIVAAVALARIAAVEGVSKAELTSRLRMMNEISRNNVFAMLA